MNQVDVALDHHGYVDTPEITLAMMACLKRGGILVLDGSMTCPLPIDYSEPLEMRICTLCCLYTCDFLVSQRQLVHLSKQAPKICRISYVNTYTMH